MAILPIGFFMPLPLAMMIPFMGIQSAVMMKQAGENWQYGKRRISAMTNEDFNNLTPQGMLERSNQEVQAMIPSMEQSIKDMRQFQDFIIVEVIELIRRGLETGLGAIFGMTPQESNAFFGGTNPLQSGGLTNQTDTSTTSPNVVNPSNVPEGTVVLNPDGSISTSTKPPKDTRKEDKAKAVKAFQKLYEPEISFLQELSKVTLTDLINGAYPSEVKSQFGILNRPRQRTNGTDQILKIHQASLATHRKKVRDALTLQSKGKNMNMSLFFANANRIHIKIWFHQLVYSS